MSTYSKRPGRTNESYRSSFRSSANSFSIARERAAAARSSTELEAQPIFVSVGDRVGEEEERMNKARSVESPGEGRAAKAKGFALWAFPSLQAPPRKTGKGNQSFVGITSYVRLCTVSMGSIVSIALVLGLQQKRAHFETACAFSGLDELRAAPLARNERESSQSRERR